MNFGLPKVEHAVVVVPDLTRPLDLEPLLPDVLNELRPASVTVVVALGLHRRLSTEEIAPLQTICNDASVTLRQHDADADDLVCLSDEPPAWFAPDIIDADLIVCLGLVEPHQYAGFSGGIKGLSIGCAGRATINHLHSLALLRDPGTAVGNLMNNRFQQTLWDVANGLPLVWGVLQVPEGSLYVGPIKEAFERACAEAARRHFFEVATPLEWLRLIVPPAKASNFYQASRAATYAALCKPASIVPQGWLIVEAACHEGMGTGSGERAFCEALKRGRDVLLDELHQSDRVIGGGEQRAYVLARTLQNARLAVVSQAELPELERFGIPIFRTFDEAHRVLRLGAHGLTVENPFHQVPRLATP
ncbi:MAG: lactate racemase domain-containing protein [bacterium]